MGTLTDIATIARWEVKKSFTMLGRDVLPFAVILFVLLVVVTGFAAQTGMHLQDGMYVVGVDDPQIADLLASDARFTVYSMDSPVLLKNQNAFDLIVVKGTVYSSATDKGKAAQKTLERDYSKYVNSIYNTETDLFAAYPLWIDTQSVKSELNFLATQSGQYISANPLRTAPVPEGEIKTIPTPSPTLAISEEELRAGLVQSNAKNTQFSRYTEALSSDSPMGDFKTAV
jgi:hypothetical protein